MDKCINFYNYFPMWFMLKDFFLQPFHQQHYCTIHDKNLVPSCKSRIIRISSICGNALAPISFIKDEYPSKSIKFTPNSCSEPFINKMRAILSIIQIRWSSPLLLKKVTVQQIVKSKSLILNLINYIYYITCKVYVHYSMYGIPF